MPEDNAAVVARFEQAILSGEFLAAIDRTCHPDMVDHNPRPGAAPNRDGFKEGVKLYHEAFSFTGLDLKAVIGQDDLVATLWSVRGTHVGEFFETPATGKDITGEGMNFYRLGDGKIVEVWTQFDALGLLQQLGSPPK
jgi:predicted ester cyclase